MARPPGVVGLDLSLASTGVARVDGKTTTIKPNAGPLEPARRLFEIVTAVDYQLTGTGDPIPTLAVLEAHHYAAGRGATAGKLAELAGAVKLRLFELDVVTVTIPAATLKKWATGNGGASKDEMLIAAEERGGKPANDDEADAYLLRAIGQAYGAGTWFDRQGSDEIETRIRKWLKGGTL